MLRLVYPRKCLFCGRPSDKSLVCIDCINNLDFVPDGVCERCGIEKEKCNCKIGDFAFSEIKGVFYYKGAAKHLLIRYKFHKKPALSACISDYMSKLINVKYNNFTFDYITFVPSTKLKVLFRGFNPVELIAKRISEKLQKPLLNALSCKFRLVSQKHLKKKDRRRKTEGKFKIKDIDVAGKRILLIDDIKTSGSTLSECSYVLKKAGAKEVRCATFAITLKK